MSDEEFSQSESPIAADLCSGCQIIQYYIDIWVGLRTGELKYRFNMKKISMTFQGEKYDYKKIAPSGGQIIFFFNFNFF
jgi:hypothetical protein